jgi:hypothetical protein
VALRELVFSSTPQAPFAVVSHAELLVSAAQANLHALSANYGGECDMHGFDGFDRDALLKDTEWSHPNVLVAKGYLLAFPRPDGYQPPTVVKVGSFTTKKISPLDLNYLSEVHQPPPLASASKTGWLSVAYLGLSSKCSISSSAMLKSEVQTGKQTTKMAMASSQVERGGMAGGGGGGLAMPLC